MLALPLNSRSSTHPRSREKIRQTAASISSAPNQVESATNKDPSRSALSPVQSMAPVDSDEHMLGAHALDTAKLK